jgi:hypothetical protein
VKDCYINIIHAKSFFHGKWYFAMQKEPQVEEARARSLSLSLSLI